jgi:sigma-B regulation protein RsbU (phosphoserine phosphatase)
MYSFPLISQQLVPADLARLQTELELAHRVQLSLLPKAPPSIPGLDLWGISHPASHVGGDFYDFIVRPNRTLTFFIGDVSGKGLPAAMLMTMTRIILRAEADSPIAPNPETILQNANAKLLADFLEAGTFVTVFVGQYCPSSRELLYANAGHSPVIFRPTGGRSRLLEADGTALGVLQETFSRNQCLCLKKGDVLIAATDGLNEARNPRHEQFGLGRLLNQMYQLDSQPAAEISGSILGTVWEFSSGKPQADDQTVVVLRCTG